MDLQGKYVLLGVTGGIAAYKMANVASALKKLGADVEVIMTENATHFITPLVFETLTGHKCMVDTFDRDFKFEVTHISLAKKADIVLVAPATANVIAKMAHGIADDMLTTVVLAARCPKLVSPAMNTGMLENPITQDNLRTLEHYGFTVIPSESGVLACKDVGSGRLPKEDVLLEYILHTIARPKDLAGVRIAVTAGPTQEPLDPVRYLTNHSTGKMGYAIARAAAMRGAEVTLIHGHTDLPPVRFTTDVPITTAQDMYDAVTSRFEEMDVLVMAAAVYYLYNQMYGTTALGVGLLFDVSDWRYWVLPVCSMSLGNVAFYAMWLRRYMVDESNKDYVRLALAKGVSESNIALRHIFRNAMVPLVQYIPSAFLNTVVGSIYIESLYSIPGMGGLLVTCVQRHDNTMVQGIVLLYACVGIIGLILGDLLMVLIDPRISFGKKEGGR